MAYGRLTGHGCFDQAIRHDPAFGIATQIVRGDRDIHERAIAFDDVENRFDGQRRARKMPGLVQRPQDSSAMELRTLGPDIDSDFAPARNRYSSDPLVLAHQVRDHPSTVPLLYVIVHQCGSLGPAQACTDQDTQQRSVTFSDDGVDVWQTEQFLYLLKR